MSEGAEGDPGPWFAEAFRAEYLEVYAHRSDAAAAAEIEFVVDALAAPPGGLVLDAGCGAGRHTRALSARGVRVVGFDLSLDLLRSAVGHAGPPQAVTECPAYVRGDLRRLPFVDGCFVGVASLFTTFGYFDDAENSAQLAEARRVLAPGGHLVLDFLNADRVRATLVPRSERELAGNRIVEVRAIRDGRVEKDVRLQTRHAPPRTWRESVRLYAREELESLFRSAGLEVVSVHGDLAGVTWSSEAPRTVLVGRAA